MEVPLGNMGREMAISTRQVRQVGHDQARPAYGYLGAGVRVFLGSASSIWLADFMGNVLQLLLA